MRQMATNNRKRRRVDPEVLGKIEKMALTGYTPSQIHDILGKDEHTDADSLPDLRSVQRIVREDILPRDPSDKWTVPGASGDDVHLVVKTLGDVIMYTNGRITSLTEQEAASVITVSRAAPDLPPLAWYVLARMYLKCKETGVSPESLDHFLALAPWSEPEGRWCSRYRTAVDCGYVKEVPSWLQFDLAQIIHGAKTGQVFGSVEVVWLPDSGHYGEPEAKPEG